MSHPKPRLITGIRLRGPLVAVVVLMAACSSANSAASLKPLGSWPYPNADTANTRDAPNSAISSLNVSTLTRSWTFKLSGVTGSKDTQGGSLASIPIVQNGVVYFQDLSSNVYALSLATGRLKWKYKVDSPTLGPNGVAVADGRVYGDSPTLAFALSATTGRTIWLDSLSNTDQGTFDIQPQVANGRVYLATAAGTLPGGGSLWALKASNGDLLWKFDTVPDPDAGVVRAGGAWQTPLVNKDGSVTYGVGNPYQSADSAIAHPSQLLYTDSVVNLDAATGTLRWYFQGVPDDFQDFDMNASPISASINGVSMIIDSGKMGYVYAMGAQNGKLIWKTPVGKHNEYDDDSLQALKHKSVLKAPYTILPGAFGGVLTNMAFADRTVYVVVCDLPFTITNLNEIVGKAPIHKLSPATGEVEALDASTGKVLWDTKVRGLPLGAATVSNDLVFTTLYQGVLIALNRNTGAVVYRRRLTTSTNAPIAVAGNTVLVPAGGPTNDTAGLNPQLLAYTVS